MDRSVSYLPAVEYSVSAICFSASERKIDGFQSRNLHIQYKDCAVIILLTPNLLLHIDSNRFEASLTNKSIDRGHDYLVYEGMTEI